MGNAAHGTSSSIGMGMNTTLRDAQKVNQRLETLDDHDLELALPPFMNDRDRRQFSDRSSLVLPLLFWYEAAATWNSAHACAWISFNKDTIISSLKASADYTDRKPKIETGWKIYHLASDRPRNNPKA
jgi:hypothetical protein